MGASIPVSRFVNVLPSVISAGGQGLDLVGLFLTSSTQIPYGVVLSFSTAADVATYFGALSTEATLATVYFAGYDGSPIKPAKIYFSQYATAPIAAYLRGGSMAGTTLAQLQALSGTLTITVNGSAKTSSTINLSAATSFSNAATLILAGFTSPGFTVSYDSLSGAFVFLDSTTGTSSTLTVATGTLAAGLKLTSATGAVLSQGAAASVPGSAMDAVVALNQDFVSFSTTWEPSDSDKVAFAQWADGKSQRFAYVGYTNNAAATTNGDTTSFGPLVVAAGYDSVIPIYDPTNGASVSAFVMGAIASLDTNATNGRATLAYRTGNVSPGVTNQTIGDNLISNGYNYVASVAEVVDAFVIFYPGQITGSFDWIDSWVSQVWLNNLLQNALFQLLVDVGQIPYNDDGYALIRAAMLDPVQKAVNFGAIRAGITLSNAQSAEIDNLVGGNASDTVQQRGWFIKVDDAAADVRAARGSPSIHLIYTDGQSVQRITLNSVAVQ